MKRNPWGRVAFYIAIIITCVVIFFPAFWLFVTSLTKRTSLLASAGLFPSMRKAFCHVLVRHYNQGLKKRLVME